MKYHHVLTILLIQKKQRRGQNGINIILCDKEQMSTNIGVSHLFLVSVDFKLLAFSRLLFLVKFRLSCFAV